jgi:hypothetical protein
MCGTTLELSEKYPGGWRAYSAVGKISTDCGPPSFEKSGAGL